LSCPINPHRGANKAKTQQKIARQHEKIRRARKAFNHKLSTKLVKEYGAITVAKSEVRKITRRPKPIVNKQGTGYDPNGASIKSQFNKTILANAGGQLTTLIEQKAVVSGREYIEVAPKDIPDEPRQRAEHYSKRLRLPRAVHLSAFQQGRYRSWEWKSKPGESSVTLNQETVQAAPLLDEETTSKPSSSSTEERERVGVPPPISTSSVSNQPPKQLSSAAGGKLPRADSQDLSGTESRPATFAESEPSTQPQEARRRRAAPSASENPSGRRKQRPPVENDSS